MNNSQKQIIWQRQSDGKTQSFGRGIQPNTLTRHQGEIWTEIGFEQPHDILSCWIVSEHEVIDSIRKCEPFPYYEPTEYFNRLSFIGHDHIEGYLGRKDMDISFHHTIHTTYSYFKDYANRKPLYMTFDRVALYKVVTIFPENPLRFVLKQLTNRSHKKDQSFMIMPFKFKHLNAFYTTKFKPFLKEELSIDICRADDFNGNDVIVETIYRFIEESEFIIADTTHCNKNAFYELGYAAAMGKEIITIQNKAVEQQLFFDRAHIRAILYNPKDLKPFFKELKNTIEAIRSRLA